MLFWILLFPAIGALLNGVLFASGIWGRVLGREESSERRIVSVLAPGVILLSAVLSSIAFFELLGMPGGERSIVEEIYVWIPSGSFAANFDLLFDPISAVMALVVTWVSFLIHVYSIGYMRGDEGYSRYFAYLNLFVFFMLILVLGNNFVLMFVGWEGVGLSSYLLIGFWYDDALKASAGKKAFIANRIGDFGFLLGILLIFFVFGSVGYGEVFAKAGDPAFASTVPVAVFTVIALLLFVGAVGKSAQFPLYVWLPDAMAGPTPVSALIHAATMVTAGVYMVARCNVFYTASPHAQMVVVSVAAFTAFFAATIALTQNDIKKVLAYSTVSQIGYMLMGVGCGAYAAGMFHLTTHAFFKALLFLGAGSVIHALHQEQDIRNMGGLRKGLPVTSATFLVATLAIAGIPLFSGFFSKDEVLASLHARGYIVHWAIGVATAVLTAFYMLRLYLLTFEGESRVPEQLRRRMHESPPVMLIPLLILAVLSVVGGYIGVPDFMGSAFGVEHSNVFERFLSGAIYPAAEALPPVHPVHLFGHWTLVAFSVAAALVGIWIAFFMYVVKPNLPEDVAASAPLNPLYRGSAGKWYVDEIYDYVFVKPYRGLSELAGEFDLRVIDGMVDGLSNLVREFAGVLRLAQSGMLRNYAGLIALGAIAIVVYMITRAF